MLQLLKILLLGDSEADAETIQHALKKEKLHFEPRLVKDKKAFLHALHQFQPDVVLTDNSLQQFNASDVLSIVRENSLHTPVILVTNTVSEEFAANIIKMGADDYILKDKLVRLPAAILTSVSKRTAEKEKLEFERKLIQSAANYRALVERVSDAFIALDTSWNYTYINKRAAEMINRDPASLIGKCIWHEFPDMVGSPLCNAFGRAMSRQQFITHIDYSEPLNIWQESSIYPSRDGISVFIKDITEKKHAAEELQTAKDRLFFHINNSPLGFIEWDSQFRIKSWCKKAERIFGWTEEEALNYRNESPGEGEDVAGLGDMARQMMSGENHRSIQQKNHTKDGRIICCEWFNSVSKDKDGDVIVMSLVQDISERINSEENLTKSEARLKEAQSIAHISNWEVDFKTNVHIWSDEMYEILGLNKNEVRASMELFFSVIHPHDIDFARREFQRAFDSVENAALTFRFIRKDGTIGYGYSKWRYELRNTQPVRLFGILQDITGQKESENELKATNDQLRSLSAHLQNILEEERIHIAREIHDELGQQLTALKMDMCAIGKRMQTEDPVIKQKLNGIIGLIDDTVKSVRRISSNLRPSILDDLGLIAALEWHSQEMQKRSGIQIDFLADIPEPELTIVVATGIFRIYQEALTNAIRHAYAHLITSSLRLEDNCLVLEINDDGRGMDEKLIRQKKTLGLLGMKERTFLLGGTFDLQTSPGKGTRIKLALPLSAYS